MKIIGSFLRADPPGKNQNYLNTSTTVARNQGEGKRPSLWDIPVPGKAGWRREIGSHFFSQGGSIIEGGGGEKGEVTSMANAFHDRKGGVSC